MPARGPVRPGRIKVTWIKLPKAAQAVAAEALRRQEKLPKSKRGGLSRSEAGKQGITSGRARAASIARGELQPAEDLRDFFNRFRSTFERSADKAWEDSKIQQAWDLWGGEPAREAVERALVPRRNPHGFRVEHTKDRLLAWSPGALHNPPGPRSWRAHMPAGDLRRLDALHARMVGAQQRAARAYQLGDYTTAEDEDARADEYAAQLEAVIAHMEGDVADGWWHVRAWGATQERSVHDPWGVVDTDAMMGPIPVHEILASTYGDYLAHKRDPGDSASAFWGQDDRSAYLGHLLRARVNEFYTLLPEVTDDQLIEAAVDSYTVQLQRRERQRKGNPASRDTLYAYAVLWNDLHEELELEFDDFDSLEFVAPEFARRTGMTVLGGGADRIVFDMGGGSVLKLPIGIGGAQANVRECGVWQLWDLEADEARGIELTRKWLAPVLDCDAEGEWLVMAKAFPARSQELPDLSYGSELSEELDELGITDAGPAANWGRLRGGQLVLIDYGTWT